jgi:hypothetical protein
MMVIYFAYLKQGGRIGCRSAQAVVAVDGVVAGWQWAVLLQEAASPSDLVAHLSHGGEVKGLLMI